jgi:methionine-rich copper-binding protein CopC
VVLATVAAAPAVAHTALRSTSPAAGATVDEAPSQVVLRLEEAPLPVGNVVRVTTGSGTVVSTGKAVVVGDEVRQPVDVSAAGTYRVAWRVTSDDGHPVSGAFRFTVRAVAAPSSTSAPAPAAPQPSAAAAAPARPSGHHGSVHAGDEFTFLHVAGTVVILLLGALGCAISLRRART